MSEVDVADGGDELGGLVEAGLWSEAVAYIEQNWTAVLAADPSGLLHAVERIPAPVVEDFPRMALARSYLQWIVPGEGERTSRFRGARMPARPRDLFDALLQLSFGAIAERDAGRTDEAVVLSVRARELLDHSTPQEYALIRPAAPEMKFVWAFSHERAGDLDTARREYVNSYDSALTIGDEMGRARAASALTWIDTLQGRNVQARESLAVVAEADGHWWSPRSLIPARLAEAMLLIDECRFAEARAVLDAVDLRWVRSRWPAFRMLTAGIAESDVEAMGLLSQIDADAASMPEDARGDEGTMLVAIARNILLRRIGNEEAAAAALDLPEVGARTFAGRFLQAWRMTIDARAGRYRRLIESAERLALESSSSPRIMVIALGIRAAAEQHKGMRHARISWEMATNVARREGLFAPLALGRQNEIRELLDISSIGVPDGVIAFLLSDSLRESVDPFATLTPRERAVLDARLRGLTIEQTAQAEFISVNTVKTHLRRIYRKVGVANFAQLEDAAGARADASRTGRTPASS